MDSPKSIEELCRASKVKYIVVTGGTMSGLGKGTTISSIGVTLKSRGVKVTSIKIDPYLNVDAGTMSPYEHGECYVLEDGGEVDLDLGNYERFLDITLTKDHNMTSGKVFQKVINKERAGDYLGKTVQLVPQVTDEIQSWIIDVAKRPVDRSGSTPDVCLIEVGGTVGDIESAMYLEALQQLIRRVGRENMCLCHISYVPVMGEQKTKPTQHGAKELRIAGLLPDFIFCRCEEPLSSASRNKISLFTQVPPENVISVHDVENLYRVPLVLEEQNVSSILMARLGIQKTCQNNNFSSEFSKFHTSWWAMVNRISNPITTVRIGIVGKYTGLTDSYLSLLKALQHSSNEAQVGTQLVWIESSCLEEGTDQEKYNSAWNALKSVNGVICPGGFGDRGIIGKSLSSKFCRENKIPYLGICLGMQTAVIDMARHVLGYKDANSEEFNPNASKKVVISMPEHVNGQMGGSMRLGRRATIIRDQSSLAAKLYDGEPVVDERHRHRYEVNPEFVKELECHGLRFVGQDERGQRMEIAELIDHPFFICVQYHPEFTSRPLKPNPLFLGLVLASCDKLQQRLQANGGKLKSGEIYTTMDA